MNVLNSYERLKHNRSVIINAAGFREDRQRMEVIDEEKEF